MSKFSTIQIFMKCIEVILKNEGGYVWNKDDPGGETNMGIARLFYPDLDIKNLTRNQAIEIYHEDYWNKMNLLGIHDETLVLQIFDMGVNTRHIKWEFRTALRMIQRLVKAEADGIIGPITRKLINNYPEPEELVDLYKRERKKYYCALAKTKPHMQIFLVGWLDRIENTKF